MGHFRIVKLTNRRRLFYQLLGPFLSRRDVVRETGFPIWDDDGKVWFVALRQDAKVLGFAAATAKGNTLALGSAYTRPEHRRQGIHSALTDAREAYGRQRGAEKLTTTCRVSLESRYQQRGFALRSRTIQFCKMEKLL